MLTHLEMEPPYAIHSVYMPLLPLHCDQTEYEDKRKDLTA